MDATKLGAFIAQLRKEVNMTQAELAGKLNVTVQAISKWERGKGLPDINMIEPLADALGVNIIEIMKAEHITTAIPQEEMNSATKDIFSFVKNVKRMQTKKSIAKGLLALLILSVCLWIGTQIYDYHHPYLEISYGTAHSDNILKTMPTVIIIEKSLLGYSSEIKQQLKEWHIAVTDMEVSFNNHHEKPLCITNDSPT